MVNTLAQYADSVAAGTVDAIAKSAEDIADAAKGNTSGSLADSITTDVADDGLSATITANSEYAAYVEYGVSIPEIKAKAAKALHFVKDGKDVFARSARAHTIEPRPFLTPAFEEKAQGLTNNLTQILQGE